MRFRLLTCSSVLLLSSFIITAAQMAPQSTPAPQHRPTSTPYSGDLSIFETPGRARSFISIK